MREVPHDGVKHSGHVNCKTAVPFISCKKQAGGCCDLQYSQSHTALLLVLYSYMLELSGALTCTVWWKEFSTNYALTHMKPRLCQKDEMQLMGSEKVLEQGGLV